VVSHLYVTSHASVKTIGSTDLESKILNLKRTIYIGKVILQGRISWDTLIILTVTFLTDFYDKKKTCGGCNSRNPPPPLLYTTYPVSDLMR